MKFEFKIQDPTNPETTYILEEIIHLVQKGGMVKWRGIYSWTTGKTLTRIFLDDPDVKQFLSLGSVSLVFGLDTITTENALHRLVELNQKYSGFESKVFHNDISDLFHPKISHFEFENGQHVLLVGSGNFTLTGLQTNIEAYTITSGSFEEITSISAWDKFLDFHSSRIRDIDEEAFLKAKENKANFTKKNSKLLEKKNESASIDENVPVEDQNTEEEAEEIINTSIVEKLSDRSRILIAQIPNAGSRWNQIHYNAEVIKLFFQAKSDSYQRIFLKEVKQDGTLGIDEVRPVVYSHTNKNYKIEVASLSAKSDYPIGKPPIIILREVGVRNFLYMIIMPGQQSYLTLVDFVNSSQSVGKGLKRIMTDSEKLKNLWVECPLMG